MKDYWYIFLIAIFCAIFSKQIDAIMARVIKGKRNRIVFYCVFFVLQSIVWISSEVSLNFLTAFVVSTALPIWVLIIKLVCLIFNCLMLFSCYSKICDVDDLEMLPRTSRYKKQKEAESADNEENQNQELCEEKK